MSVPLRSSSVQIEETTSRGRMIWFILSVLFTLGNVAGGVFAARSGELAHAGVHAVLVLLGAKVAWRLTPERFRRTPAISDAPTAQVSYGDLGERLLRIEQSVEAIAIEVERVGEGQRFLTRLYSKGDGSAEGGAP